MPPEDDEANRETARQIELLRPGWMVRVGRLQQAIRRIPVIRCAARHDCHRTVRARTRGPHGGSRAQGARDTPPPQRVIRSPVCARSRIEQRARTGSQTGSTR